MLSVGSSLSSVYQPSALTTFTTRSISVNETLPASESATRFPPVDESDATAAPGTDGEQAAVAAEQSKREQLSKAEAELALAEQQEMSELAARDREVRAHEQAHVAVGGQYAGTASYSYERGPDGRQYAVAGEVPISTSPVSGDPQATIDKMEQVRRAALAPAEPSSADRAIAAQAAQLIAQARAELATAEADDSVATAAPSQASETQEQSEAEATGEPAATPVADLALYRSIAAEPGGPSLQASA
ncbi:putative metalloprotease CJM1_0395 family protein [Halopseudomonas maritima]|uniref:putative metalloprotease CJM1_0395 family protein n=1 Tax=Halopseudomonas maritima TaxID=2918528 RepID=UPI001EEAD36C|nr:putative metalloprotease CJM1_0395 family protein [Halopseudomonas maritima]UJJ30627.1 hypothetical protein HV822_12680 [Halopseudomonas maritima]